MIVGTLNPIQTELKQVPYVFSLFLVKHYQVSSIIQKKIHTFFFFISILQFDALIIRQSAVVLVVYPQKKKQKKN